MPAILIYLMGVDGSGKTSVTEYMEQRLRAENHSVQCVWATLHPVILWPIIKVAKFVLVRKHNKFENYLEHIKVKNEGVRRFRFLLKPLFYISLLDYYPQYLWKVVQMGRNTDYLICDRYFVDMMMERAILESAGPERVVEWMRRFGRFFRKPDLTLYLRTAPEVAIKRKTDIPSEAYLRERTRHYDALAEVLQAHVINADQPLQDVLARVKERIDDLDRRTSSLPR